MIAQEPAKQARFRADKMGKSDLASSKNLFCGLNAFEPGQSHAAHVHPNQDKLYVVLQGVANVTIGGAQERVSAGAVALAPAGIEHAIENPGPDRLVVLVVMSPPPSRQD